VICALHPANGCRGTRTNAGTKPVAITQQQGQIGSLSTLNKAARAHHACRLRLASFTFVELLVCNFLYRLL